MKILLAAHVFPPSVGGIETCSLDLALGFVNLGHEVQVITQTLTNNPGDDHDLKVIRRPGISALFRAIRWCDVFFQNNLSLQTAWPLVFFRKPWVVCTQTWLKNLDGSTGGGVYYKKLALRFATNVYISAAIRDHVGHRGVIIPNPYNSETFRLISGIQRERSLVFLGRLVSDKGCDLLIQSMAMLRADGLVLPLTIIGSGPEESTIKKQIAAERLDDLVHFAGMLTGEALVTELNRHEVLVVPSRWDEPFGIVALEGIACGCLVVGSAGGGLPDAIGPCGAIFKNNDVASLSSAIRQVLGMLETGQITAEVISIHLNHHHRKIIAARYLEVFCRCLKGHKNFDGHG